MIDGMSERLTELRKRIGLSQREVAQRINVAHPTVGAYETGSRTPSPLVLAKLCSLYSCSADYLLGLKKTSSYINVDGLSPAEIKAINELIQVMRNEHNNKND